jgi:integrase
MWGELWGHDMGKLSALAIKAAKEPGRYHDGDGLMLDVKKSGSASWLLRVQVNGKRRDFGLGSLSQLSLSQAREKADEMRRQCRSGIDPVALRREEKSVRPAIPTFEEAATLAHEEQKGGWRNAKHKAQWISSLKAYAFPHFGQLAVDQVDGPAIREALIPIWLSKPETARRVRQRVGAVLDWAYSKGLRQTEAPMRSIGKGLPRQPKKDGHFAALPYVDVPALMAKLAEANSVGRVALRFLILTAARSGEVRGARWDEFNFEAGIWTVPAGRMKAGKVHMVPLSNSAIAALEIAKGWGRSGGDEIVFPGLRFKPMSDMTLAKVLRTATTANATVHGFRSAFRDWAAECTDVAGDVVEAALAHTISNRVEAAYRRTNYLEKRRGLMETWANYVSIGVVK